MLYGLRYSVAPGVNAVIGFKPSDLAVHAGIEVREPAADPKHSDPQKFIGLRAGWKNDNTDTDLVGVEGSIWRNRSHDVTGVGITLGRNDVRQLRLGVLLAGAINFVDKGGTGVFAGGLFNEVHDETSGLVMSGLVSYVCDLKGVSLAGLCGVFNDLRGVSLAGVYGEVFNLLKGVSLAGLFQTAPERMAGAVGALILQEGHQNPGCGDDPWNRFVPLLMVGKDPNLRRLD